MAFWFLLLLGYTEKYWQLATTFSDLRWLFAETFFVAKLTVDADKVLC